jgi:rod shape-determining protein MreC
MRWIIELLIRYRTAVSLLLAVSAGIAMVSSPPGLQAKTARVLTVSIFYPLQITVDQVLRAKNIYAENRQLKNEVASLSASVATLREQESENTRFRSMLDFEQTSRFTLVPVRVVAHDPSPFFKSVIVTAGANKGVLPFMPVVGERGVAGKVVQVMPTLSLVQLLKDPLNRTSIMVRRSRVVSILETENGADFFARFRTHESIEAGDTLVTSGLGGIYPPGFTIGTVNRVLDQQDPLFKTVAVRLSLDLDHCEDLFIVRLPPQWAAFKVELDSLAKRQQP